MREPGHLPVEGHDYVCVDDCVVIVGVGAETEREAGVVNLK